MKDWEREQGNWINRHGGTLASTQSFLLLSIFRIQILHIFVFEDKFEKFAIISSYFLFSISL